MICSICLREIHKESVAIEDQVEGQPSTYVCKACTSNERPVTVEMPDACCWWFKGPSVES